MTDKILPLLENLTLPHLRKFLPLLEDVTLSQFLRLVLENLTLPQLREVKKAVKTVLREVKEKNEIAKIKAGVAEYGYHFSLYDHYHIPELKCGRFPVNLSIIAFDKADKTDAHPDAGWMPSKQKAWVEKLGFEFTEEYIRRGEWNRIGKWDWDDDEAPAVCDGEIYINIYHQTSPPEAPARGTKFLGFADPEGDDVYEYHITEEGDIFQGETRIGQDEDWDEYHIILLKKL